MGEDKGRRERILGEKLLSTDVLCSQPDRQTWRLMSSRVSRGKGEVPALGVTGCPAPLYGTENT